MEMPGFGYIIDEILSKLPTGIECREEEGQLNITAPPEMILPVVGLLQELGACNYLGNLTAVDYGEEYELVYHLYMIPGSEGLAVKTRIKADRPVAYSVCQKFPGADWQEREVYDLMGIVFLGHPGLERILLPEGFAGHPLRKDFGRADGTVRPDAIGLAAELSLNALYKGNAESECPKGQEVGFHDPLTPEPLFVNVGPQHPSTHGGLHVEAVMQGEIVSDAIVHLGYVHRSVEKIAESRTYAQFLPYTSRLDYLATHLPTLGYVQAVEKLLDVQPTERAEYIRVIMGELSRIASHMIFIGSLAIDLGAVTGLVYTLRDRERIMNMFEMCSGQRLIASYMRIGGVSHDLPEEFFPYIRAFIDDVPAMIKEYHGLITGNEILQARCRGVGVLAPGEALALGVTGPNLRASGIDYDLRRDSPYGIYERFPIVVPLGENGDCWDRLMVRVKEIEASAAIIDQAVKDMPGGPVQGKAPKVPRVQKGREVYHRIESARGELGYYIVGDGSDKPYRLHVRAPSFINLMALPVVSRGGRLQDVIANIATLDPVLGESDR